MPQVDGSVMWSMMAVGLGEDGMTRGWADSGKTRPFLSALISRERRCKGWCSLLQRTRRMREDGQSTGGWGVERVVCGAGDDVEVRRGVRVDARRGREE